MKRLTWKSGTIFGVGLRHNVWGLGQMLEDKPFVLFFEAFAKDDEWTLATAEGLQPLFFCAVMDQFFRWSVIRKTSIAPMRNVRRPEFWLNRAHVPGRRTVRLWSDTEKECSVSVMGDQPTGRLLADPVVIGRAPFPPLSQTRMVGKDDTDLINRYDLDSIWSSPALNERLYLCHRLGRSVNPEKDIGFDQAIPLEYYDYFAMRERKSVEGMGFIRAHPADP